MKLLVSILAALLLSACASNEPKRMFAGERARSEVAVIHPTAVPGGLMLITALDEKSTYTMSIGYFGSLQVLPDTYDIKVEVSHSFGQKDAGGPAWTLPKDVTSARVMPLADQDDPSTYKSIFVTKGTAVLKCIVQAGKTYEMKFGFDRSSGETPVPVVWLAEIPTA